MNSFQKLTKLFSDFPGIGPRQSKRFVHFLLSRNKEYITELIATLNNLKDEIVSCSSCFRYFPKNGGASPLCPLCNNPNKDATKLLVVARDVDLENMEKTGIFDGFYFVLGGIIPILEKEPEKRVRLNELRSKLEKGNFKEVIIAMNANPDGENTEDIIREYLKEVGEKKGISFFTLGRGLSSGVELEYSDPNTLKNAFLNRH